MRLEATDLRNAIVTGIKSLVGRTIQLTGERGEDPRPEYLTTAAICFSLCDFAEGQKGNGGVRIRSEEQTSDIWDKGLVRAFLGGLRRSLFPKPGATFRKGNVDITLFSSSGFEHPFGVVENKGLLHFTQDGNLYAGSRVEVEKDLVRNSEFVLRHGGAGGVQYSAFTFYVRDKASVTKADGEAQRLKTKKQLIRVLQSLNLAASLRTNILIETFDDDLYESEDAAREPDEHGAPAHDMHPAWHLLFGVISIYRVGNEVVDEQRLFECDQLPQAASEF